MRIEFKPDNVLNMKFDNLIIELQTQYCLCTVYRPGSRIGERLGAFLYKGMTATEFFDEIRKLSEL